jgi:hypothetical protein
MWPAPFAPSAALPALRCDAPRRRSTRVSADSRRRPRAGGSRFDDYPPVVPQDRSPRCPRPALCRWFQVW